MATEYKLSYTASEIDEKLGKVDENATNISQLSEQNEDLTSRVETLEENGTGTTVITGTSRPCKLKDGNYNVLAINHRGYSTEAPENTIPAYILSKEKGFNYVECDVNFTSDGVAVLLHNSTIDATSDGSGSISEMTYYDVLQYDFGSWKSADYTGTKIATFEEFIKLCKTIGLHPYIELKGGTQEEITGLVDMVKRHGMERNVTYIAFGTNGLTWVKNADSTARIGYLADITEGTIKTVKSFMTGENEVFLDVNYNLLTDEKINLCIENDIPLEIYTVNTASIIEEMDEYVTGVTSDNLIAGKVLYDKYMTYTAPEYISTTGISLDKTTLVFEDSASQTLVATVVPENSDDKVVWSSSSEEIATVENGIVTPVSEGSCTITVTSGDYSATCEVTVNTKEVVTYTITRNLTGCTSSSTTTTVTEGSSHTEEITVSDGFTMEGATISVTMDGSDISSNYTDGVLTIDSVTGDIVITISAEVVIEATYELYVEFTGEDECVASGTAGEIASTGYRNANGARISFVDTTSSRIVIEEGYTYKAEFEGNISAIGIHQYNQERADQMLEGVDTTSKRIDSGWQSNGYEFEQETINDLPAVSCVIVFQNDGNRMTTSDLVSCKIYRKAS